MSDNNKSGGPWGSGGRKGGDDQGPWGGGPRGPNGRRPTGGGPNRPPNDIDEIMRRGQERLRVLMGGGGRGPGGSGFGDWFGRGSIAIGLLAAFAFWLFMSFYQVRPEEQSVELFLGRFSGTGEPGLNFAPWPLVSHEIRAVRVENTENIGTASARNGSGLMLTGDENIVDVEFQVVWNISDLSEFLFNLADPQETIRAVSESAMREVIGRSELDPILNRDRGLVSSDVQTLIQATLDTYQAGINVVRLNLDRVDPPREVIDAFRDVQAAEQERGRFENQADAYANERLAQARGEAAQLLEEAEGYRARVVNEATGEASRFVAVYEEYDKAQEVTRKRLYLETLERVLGATDKIIIDNAISGSGGGQGVVPYLPLNELRRGASAGAASGGNN